MDEIRGLYLGGKLRRLRAQEALKERSERKIIGKNPG